MSCCGGAGKVEGIQLDEMHQCAFEELRLDPLGLTTGQPFLRTQEDEVLIGNLESSFVAHHAFAKLLGGCTSSFLLLCGHT